MEDPLAIVEGPSPVPEAAVEVDLAEEWTRLLLRCSKLESLLEVERRQAQERLRDVLVGLVEIADALDRILEQLTTGGDGKSTPDRSLELTRRLLTQQLEKVGVHSANALGKPLQPAIADVEGYRENEELPDETVVEEITRAYVWRGTVLRRGKVVVSLRSGRT